MKINTGAPSVVSAPASSAAKTEPKPQPTGLEQLEKFVTQIHAAVDAKAVAIRKKNGHVPEAYKETKAAADALLDAAKEGRSLSPAEVAQQLSALLWELDPAQLNQLHDGLEATAKDYGELARMQHRMLPGMPVKMAAVVDLLTGASKVPTSVEEADLMLAEVTNALAKAPNDARLLEQQKAVEGLKARLQGGEAIIRPLSLPTTQAGAHQAINKLTEQLGDLHAQLAAVLGDQPPEALTGDAKAKFDELSGDALKLGKDLATLETYAAQLDGYVEPSGLDRTGLLVGVSLGPAWDLAQWIPGFPVPVFGGIGAGMQFFEKDKATGERKVDWYGAANLQTPFGGGGYALSPSKKGFSWAFNPPLGSRLGISLANHPFHGRKLDVFIPGLFRAEATATGALALTLFAPVPIPGLKVGVTVLVRNPVLANITGPVLWAMDKVFGVARKALELGKEGAKAAWHTLMHPPPPAQPEATAPV